MPEVTVNELNLHYELDDFIAKSERDPEEMASELLEAVGSVQEPYLKKLLDSFFKA